MSMVRKAFAIAISLQTGWLYASDDVIQFYQEEAKVVSASRLPHAENQTPATVYVVTQEDIKNSGAINIWDALRSVPGLNVMSTRTGQGEVGVQGITRALNNRTLILLDGQSVFNPFFDYVTWESLPVHLDEIDRIEVVEGPASAVYGANAMSGVVNIITKRPEQVNGTQVTYTGGERSTQRGSLTFGKKYDKTGVRLGGGWNSTNRFSDASRLAAQAGHFDAEVTYDLAEKSSIDVAGGYNKFNVDNADGIDSIIEKGERGFFRGNYKFHDTLFKTSWNHGREAPEQTIALPSGARLDYDTYQTGVEQTVALPWKNTALLGLDYEGQDAHSTALVDSKAHQDRWSIFAEDKWDFTNKWLLMTSFRVDRHPLTPLRFSPRGSLLYTPVPEQVFRVSAGTSYRNPNLIENYLSASATTPSPGLGPLTNPPFTQLNVNTLGNRNLDPESLSSVEVAHTGRFGRLKTTLTGYHWDNKDPITFSDITLIPNAPPPFFFAPPTVNAQRSFINQTGQVHAWGSDLAGDYAATQWLNLFANYSYISYYGNLLPPVVTARHHINAGTRTHNGGITTQWTVHWVDKQSAGTTSSSYAIPAYFLVDAHIGYAFAGAWSGLEVALNAFNLLNHAHYEYSPFEGGEIIKGRLTGTMSYKF